MFPKKCDSKEKTAFNIHKFTHENKKDKTDQSHNRVVAMALNIARNKK